MREFICYFLLHFTSVTIISWLITTAINYIFNAHIAFEPIICVVITLIATILHMMEIYF
jgi:hypothetical protein